TGVGMWSGMEQAMQQKLLPARAVQALGEFKQISEEGRAMLAGSFVEKIAAEVGTRHSALGARPKDSVRSGKGGSSPVSANGEGDEDVSFEFGSNDQHELFGAWNSVAAETNSTTSED